jgi:hypothetical protein
LLSFLARTDPEGDPEVLLGRASVRREPRITQVVLLAARSLRIPGSALADLGMKLQAEGADDFEDGIEVGIALVGERFLHAFARRGVSI